MRLCFLEMIQDFSNGFLFEDEGDDAEGATALTFQRVGEIDPSNELRPAFSYGGALFWRELGLVPGCGVIVVAERLKDDVSFFSQSAGCGRIGAEISHAVCSRLWDLVEYTSGKLEDVESLTFRM